MVRGACRGDPAIGEQVVSGRPPPTRPEAQVTNKDVTPVAGSREPGFARRDRLVRVSRRLVEPGDSSGQELAVFR